MFLLDFSSVFILQLYSKKLAQNKFFCVTVFLSLGSNYKIHSSRDICSLAIVHVDHTEAWFLFFSIRIHLIMTSSSDLKKHHISILCFWNKGVRSAPAIHRETNIPLRTIYYNINKLKQTNSLKHRCGNGWRRVLSGIEKKLSSIYST